MATDETHENAETKPAWTAPFIQALAGGATVTQAAAQAGISRQHVYRYRGQDAEFDEAWQEVYEHGTERLEAEAFRRAVKGTQKPIYHLGKRVGSVREYSDSLLMFLLKARKPDMYRERISVDDERERRERQQVEKEDEAALDKRLAGFDNVTPIKRAASG